jgi:hypothetical protein
MAVLTPLWEANPVEYLVQWKFPETIAFGPLAARKRSSLSPAEWREIQNRAQAYRDQLEAMPENEFQALIEEARKSEVERYRAFFEERERSYVFNQPSADADFAHWASASYWTADEATALSLGKDPRVVTWKLVSPHVYGSTFAKDFEARRDLILRAVAMGQLAELTAPSVAIAWAERMRISVPLALVDAVRAIGVQIADWKTLYDEATATGEQLLARLNERQDLQGAPRIDPKEKQLTTRERESLLKLVIGMAIKGYSLDPNASRSPVAREIAGDLALVGVELDEDTVRKYLTEAKELLPSDETERRR